MRKMKGWLEKLNTKLPVIVTILGLFMFFPIIQKIKNYFTYKSVHSNQCAKEISFTYGKEIFEELLSNM